LTGKFYAAFLTSTATHGTRTKADEHGDEQQDQQTNQYSAK
jgi:hypothetical protein